MDYIHNVVYIMYQCMIIGVINTFNSNFNRGLRAWLREIDLAFIPAGSFNLFVCLKAT